MKLAKRFGYNKTSIFTLLFVSQLVLLPACKSSPEDTSTSKKTSPFNTSPNDHRIYEQLVLNNGLEVILISDPDEELSGAALTVHVGQYQDPITQQGLAHYLEHMLLLGSKKYPKVGEYQKYIEEHSGKTNAFTSRDKTSYFFSIAPSAFEEGVDRFSDFFKAPLFNKDFSQRELSAVNSEWNIYRQNDGRGIQAVIGQIINPNHPASRFGVGNLQTLSDKPDSSLKEELVAFYKRYYSANNMKLVLAGKQSIATLKKMAITSFTTLPNNHIEQPAVNVEAFSHNTIRQEIHFATQKEEKALSLIFPIVDNTTSWRLKANAYISYILSSQETGTLQDVLKSKGVIKNLSISAIPRYLVNSGFFTIDFDLTNQGMSQKDEIIKATLEYLDLMQKKGITAEHYSELSTIALQQFRLSKESPIIALAINFSQRMFDIDTRHLLDESVVFAPFNQQAITDVMKQLTVNNMIVWHSSPNEETSTAIPYHNGKYTVRNITKVQKERWQSGTELVFNLPPLNELITSDNEHVTKFVYSKPYKIIEQDGVETWLVHSQLYQDELGFFRVLLDSNVGYSDARSYILSSLLNNVFGMKASKIASKYSRSGNFVKIERDKHNSQYVSVYGPTKRHGKILEQLLSTFRHLDIEQKAFDIAIDNFQSWTKSHRSADLMGLLRHNVDKAIYQKRWTDDQILMAAKSITLDDVVAYHQQVLAKRFVSVIAAGNYEPKKVTTMVDTIMNILGTQKVPPQKYQWDDTIVPEQGKILSVSLDAEKDGVALADIYIYSEQSIKKSVELTLINMLFNNTFYTQMRTKDKMAYAVGSNSSEFNRYPAFSMMIQSDNTELPQIKNKFDQFKVGFYNHFLQVKDETINELKSAMLKNVNRKPKNMFEELAHFFSDIDRGNYAFDSKKRMTSAIEAVTKESLIATYNDLIMEGDAANLVVQLRGRNYRNTEFADLTQ